MKILVYLHSLEIGGGQINALTLAGAMKARGHEVAVFGPPGPLEQTAAGKGLEVIRQQRPQGRPSLRAAGTLRRMLRGRPADVVHAYSHSASVEAFLGAYLWSGTPVVGTVAEALPRPFPTPLQLIVRIQRLAEDARRSGYPNVVHLQRTPIDTDADAPGRDGSDFRRAHGLDDGRPIVLLVSRLATYMKLEGLERAIDAVAMLAESTPARLVVVGGGPRYQELLRRAEDVNSRLGERAIVLTGPMLDPRPAYTSADVVMGIAGSVLRGMAFGKPGIVLGEQGFSEIVAPETVGRFLRDGFFALGDGDLDPRRLRDQIATLVGDTSLRERLGRFSRQVICDEFSLAAAAGSLEQIYASALGRRRSAARRVLDSLPLLATAAMGRVRRLAS